MTCQRAEPLLARAADGTLDADRSAALTLHLDACADCRDALDAQRAARELLAARPDAPVPSGFATRVMADLPDTSGRPWARPASEPAASPWLDALNWRAWTLRLAPVAGALFVGAALGIEPSTEAAGAGGADDADVVTAWVIDETAGGGEDLATVDTVTRFWQDADAPADDLLLDVLLGTEPADSLGRADEAER